MFTTVPSRVESYARKGFIPRESPWPSSTKRFSCSNVWATQLTCHVSSGTQSYLFTSVVTLGAFTILVTTPVYYNTALHFCLLRLQSALCNNRSVPTAAATVPDCPLYYHQCSATVGRPP